MPKTAQFRFYEELNDFLPPERQKKDFLHSFTGNPSVKDTIESLGVPHTEIDLILVNGKSVTFEHRIDGGDVISVYPVFESLDISPIIRLRPEPLRATRFILDTHLGKLAGYLRMLGFDTRYGNNYSDSEIIKAALEEQRIILTRDRGILKHRRVTHGYWLRSTAPRKQVIEVLSRLDLYSRVKPFTRCMQCNGLLAEVRKEDIRDKLPPKTAQYYDEFHRCRSCGRIYWKGSHYENMRHFIDMLMLHQSTSG